MKILFITSGFFPLANATRIYEYNLYQALCQQHEVDLYAVDDGHGISHAFINQFKPKGLSTACMDPKSILILPRGYSKPMIFHRNYGMDFGEEIYKFINRNSYDIVLSSFYVLDKSKVTDKTKLVYIEHDTMYGLAVETIDNPDPKVLESIRKYELDRVHENTDLVFAVSNMDKGYFESYYGAEKSLVRYLPTVVSPNENQVRDTYDVKYDVFYGGNSTWFRTYMCTNELLRLVDKFNLKSYIYIPRLRAVDRVPHDDKTILNTSTNFDDEIHSQIKYSVITHQYKSGFPTKINIGLSNGLPIIMKGSPLQYLTEDDYNRCKDLVHGYDTDEEFINLVNGQYDTSIKSKCIKFVRKYRSPEYVVDTFNEAVKEVLE